MKTLITTFFLLCLFFLKAQYPNLIPYSPDGKLWGAVNQKVEVVVKPEYDEEFIFYNYEAFKNVKKNNKIGLIDTTGKLLIEAKYDGIEGVSEGLARVIQNKKSGLFSIKKKAIVLPINYDDIGWQDGFIIASKTGKYGIIEAKNFKPISNFEFERIEYINYLKQVFIVSKNRKYAIFNAELKKLVTPLEYDELRYRFGSNENYLIGYKKGTYFKIDKNGKASVIIDSENQDQYGEVSSVPPPPPPDSWNKNGEMYNIELYYKQKNNWIVTFEKSVRDASSKEIVKSYEFKGYDTLIKLNSFTNNYDLTHGADLMVKQNKQYGIINIKNEALIPLKYDTILYKDYGYIKVIKNNLYGVYLKNDYKLVKDPMFKAVFEDSFFWNCIKVQMPNGKVGYMHIQNGKVYIPGVK